MNWVRGVLQRGRLWMKRARGGKRADRPPEAAFCAEGHCVLKGAGRD